MRRYTNWGLIFIGALFATAWIVSPAWIPSIQPYLVEETADEEFACRDYVTPEQCDVLVRMYEDTPDAAVAQQDAMVAENDFEVIDPEPQEIANQMRLTINSSDQPEITAIRTGVFNPPIDAIHNAQGTAKIIGVVALDGTAAQYYVQLASGLDGNFTVTNGPNQRIYLSQHPDPRNVEELLSGEGGALDIGRLKGNIGRQNYDLSEEVDFTRYKSLVIYSPDTDRIFGVAPFIEE